MANPAVSTASESPSAPAQQAPAFNFKAVLQRMIQPWSAVKEDYVPHFAVDWRLVTSAFVGCIQETL